MELFQEWFKFKNLTRVECVKSLGMHIYNIIHIENQDIQGQLENFVKNVECRWKRPNNYRARFLEVNKTWLESIMTFSINETEDTTIRISKPGRPSKHFSESGTRSQQKKVLNMVKGNSLDQLSRATQCALWKNGKRDAAHMVKDATEGRSASVKRRMTSKISEKNMAVPMSPDEALALIINTKSSKSIYLSYRLAAKNCNANIYPSWHKILSAKKSCYPDENSIIVTNISVEINLQALLNLTISRICKLQEEVFLTCTSKTFTLICKWGIDGSSGQSNYRQHTTSKQKDSSVLIISLVPLQLRDSQDDTNIIWQNRVPSSTRFCRAIKFIFAKETPELTRAEVDNITQQITSLQSFKYQDKNIDFNLVLTMVDGKVCNTLTETRSTQSCYICSAKPSEMNDLQNVTKKLPKIENQNFGLSSLHSWIRFFECCLHISYRLEVKTWQVRGENKNLVESRKTEIVHKLRQELGILVDQPKPGYGSTNTGNTARIFFENHKKSAEVTGLDENLIHRFYIILQTISSGYEIDVNKFHEYTMETARKYVSLYLWYNMPTSVHKVLIHGSAVINQAILPIGQLGEEAQEAKNKDFKFIREHRSRKDKAEHTNIDLFNYFLLSSDPIISELSMQGKCRRNKKLESEAMSLLKAPHVELNISM